MTIQIDFEEYKRYDEGKPRTLIIKGKTLRSCLLEILDKLRLYSEPYDIVEEEVSTLGHRMTDKELLEAIIRQSGDGSDYIFAIKNLDSGEVLYSSGDDLVVQDSVESQFDNEPSFEEQKRLYDEGDDFWEDWFGE